MNVFLITPWQNRWRESLKKAFIRAGHSAKWLGFDVNMESIQKADVILSMWADRNLIKLIESHEGKIFTYIRSYEVYEEFTDEIDWKKLRGIFFVSEHTCRMANERWDLKDIPQYYIPNWIDLDEWPLVEKPQNGKIAMVAQVNFKKCHPLALQVIDSLPKEYSLHMIGEIQDRYHLSYMDHIVKEMNLNGRIVYNGEIESEDVSKWLRDKSYILSTSIKEGCPMNILEAMAMGIKPIIHNWPGAKSLFPNELIWTRIPEILPILKNEFEPQYYRQWVEEHFSLDNADYLVEVVTNGP